MPLIAERNPWQYEGMIHDPTLNLLYKKQYKDIKRRDFFNLDYSVIPMFVDPAKIYLYRYLKLEPYLHELFTLDEEIHPVHPLMPTTSEIIKITNQAFHLTRNPMKFPLNEIKKKKRKEHMPKTSELDMLMTFFDAGESETDSHLSADEVTDWTSDDFESGSEQSIKSWKYNSRQKHKIK